jgi:transcriptional regulator GlxA family with amidase domain
MAPLQIGVMLEEVQLADIACIDLLGNISSDNREVLGQFAPPDLAANAVEMKFHYISSTLEPTSMTPSIKVIPTMTYDDAPRGLDVLLIGGPMPSHRPAGADEFMKEAVKETKNILTTCTGAMWLASSGVLDGKKATTNRLFLGMAAKMYPDVEWQDQRWVVDGKFWTSGGAFAGKSL